MVIFSHRGIGFGKKENSLEAISNAVKGGFSVEFDIRLKDEKVVLSHDEALDRGREEFSGLLGLIKDNPRIFFALHLKENSLALFKKSVDYIKPFKNCFLFITDFKQSDFILQIASRLNKEQLALYVIDRDLDLNLLDRVGYLWLDETRSDIYEDLDYFIAFKKKIICCSPEIFTHGNRDKMAYLVDKSNGKEIFGICTDYPTYYNKAR